MSIAPADMQLPTLWFAVLMAGHVLDHLIFSSRKRTALNKTIWFAIWTGLVVVSFWWFKDLALGVRGPVNSHWGWRWRQSWNVSLSNLCPDLLELTCRSTIDELCIYMTNRPNAT